MAVCAGSDPNRDAYQSMQPISSTHKLQGCASGVFASSVMYDGRFAWWWTRFDGRNAHNEWGQLMGDSFVPNTCGDRRRESVIINFVCTHWRGHKWMCVVCMRCVSDDNKPAQVSIFFMNNAHSLSTCWVMSLRLVLVCGTYVHVRSYRHADRESHSAFCKHESNTEQNDEFSMLDHSETNGWSLSMAHADCYHHTSDSVATRNT